MGWPPASAFRRVRASPEPDGTTPQQASGFSTTSPASSPPEPIPDRAPSLEEGQVAFSPFGSPPVERPPCQSVADVDERTIMEGEPAQKVGSFIYLHFKGPSHFQRRFDHGGILERLIDENRKLNGIITDGRKENLGLNDLLHARTHENIRFRERVQFLERENSTLKTTIDVMKINQKAIEKEKEKAEAELKELEEKMATMEAEMEKKEEDYKEQIRLKEEEIKEKVGTFLPENSNKPFIFRETSTNWMPP